MAQVPIGPTDKKCPLWQKPMSKVCHSCDWWRPLKIVDPNAMPNTVPRVIDEYRCAISWIPTLLLEVGHQQLANAAATEGVREEVRKTDSSSQASIVTLIEVLRRSLDVIGAHPAITNGQSDNTKLISN